MLARGPVRELKTVRSRRHMSEVETPPLLFNGGINYLDHSQVKPTQHVAGRNWWLDKDDVVRVRPGNLKWNAAALGADIQGLWDYKRSDQINWLIAYAGGQLYRGDQAFKTFTSILSGLDGGAPGWMETLQDRAWFCNGMNNPRVTDGFTTFRMGVVAPAAAPTVVLVALAGNLPAEDHFYRTTYVREESGVKVRESNPSPESTKVTNTAGSAQNDVTVAASSDSQVTHIYLYRRSAVTVSEEKLVVKLTNTTQTYRDNIAVGSLGAFASWVASGGEEDHGSPPDTITALKLHRDGRFYAWGPKSRLYYTRVLQPHYWAGASGGVSGHPTKGVSLIINEDDGDEGMALISESDDLLCLKRYNVYRLLGDGPTADDGGIGGWRVEKVATPCGCAAKLSAARGPAGTFWMCDDGPVRVDDRSGVPVLIGPELRSWWERSLDMTAAVGWVHDRWYFLVMPFYVDGKVVMQAHVYNVLNRSWWPVFDLDIQRFVMLEDGRLLWGGRSVGGGATKGRVYHWDGAINDDGLAVTAELTTRMIDPSPGTHKWFHTRLAYAAHPGETVTMRQIPDQTASYVERVVKLVGAADSRVLRLFRGTKRLQGAGVQLYLKSATTTARPAVHYWQVLAQILHRSPLAPGAFFADVVTDGVPNWGAMSPEYLLMDSYDHMA